MNEYSYSVDLQDYSDFFLIEFKKMLIDQTLVDITLASNTESIKVHKAVLAASSPYFKAQLSGKEVPVIIFESNFNVVLSIVEFIYTGKTTYLESEQKELVSAARLFQIKGLSDIKFNAEENLPDYPPPIFRTATKSEKDEYLSIQTKLSDSVIPQAFISIPLNNKSKRDNIERSSIRKRGRPKKSEIYEYTLKSSKNKVIENECIKSYNCFKYLKNIMDKNNMEEYNNDITLAVNSITMDSPHIDENFQHNNETAVWPNVTNDFENETTSELEENMPILDQIAENPDPIEECISVQENVSMPMYIKSSNGLYIEVNNDIIDNTNQNDVFEYKVMADTDGFGSVYLTATE